MHGSTCQSFIFNVPMCDLKFLKLHNSLTLGCRWVYGNVMKTSVWTRLNLVIIFQLLTHTHTTHTHTKTWMEKSTWNYHELPWLWWWWWWWWWRRRRPRRWLCPSRRGSRIVLMCAGHFPQIFGWTSLATTLHLGSSAEEWIMKDHFKEEETATWFWWPVAKFFFGARQQSIQILLVRGVFIGPGNRNVDVPFKNCKKSTACIWRKKPFMGFTHSWHRDNRPI